jgi:hypothetical protein
MKTYTVNVNGFPFKGFAVESEARNFMLNFVYAQELENKRLDLIDEAVDKSDLKDAKEVLKYIMEK